MESNKSFVEISEIFDRMIFLKGILLLTQIIQSRHAQYIAIHVLRYFFILRINGIGFLYLHEEGADYNS